MVKEEIPSWVYDNIKNFGNCALSNKFSKYTKEELKPLFKGCKLRMARYCTTAEQNTAHSKYVNYYIVEKIRRKKTI